jgi:hypothetical protein
MTCIAPLYRCTGLYDFPSTGEVTDIYREHDPSYLTLFLCVTDSSYCYPPLSFHNPPYNQILTTMIAMGILWRGSCYLLGGTSECRVFRCCIP